APMLTLRSKATNVPLARFKGYQLTLTASAVDRGVIAGRMLTVGPASTGRDSTTSWPTIPAISMAAPAACRPLQTAQTAGDPRVLAGSIATQSRGPATGIMAVAACESQPLQGSAAPAAAVTNESARAAT